MVYFPSLIYVEGEPQSTFCETVPCTQDFFVLDPLERAVPRIHARDSSLLVTHFKSGLQSEPDVDLESIFE